MQESLPSFPILIFAPSKFLSNTHSSLPGDLHPPTPRTISIEMLVATLPLPFEPVVDEPLDGTYRPVGEFVERRHVPLPYHGKARHTIGDFPRFYPPIPSLDDGILDVSPRMASRSFVHSRARAPSIATTFGFLETEDFGAPFIRVPQGALFGRRSRTGGHGKVVVWGFDDRPFLDPITRHFTKLPFLLARQQFAMEAPS